MQVLKDIQAYMDDLIDHGFPETAKNQLNDEELLQVKSNPSQFILQSQEYRNLFFSPQILGLTGIFTFFYMVKVQKSGFLARRPLSGGLRIFRLTMVGYFCSWTFCCDNTAFYKHAYARQQLKAQQHQL